MSTVAKAAASLDNGAGVLAPGEAVRKLGGGGTAAAVVPMGAVGVDGVNGVGVAAAGESGTELVGATFFFLVRLAFFEAGGASVLAPLLLAVTAATITTVRSAGCVGGFARPATTSENLIPSCTRDHGRCWPVVAGERKGSIGEGLETGGRVSANFVSRLVARRKGLGAATRGQMALRYVSCTV